MSNLQKAGFWASFGATITGAIGGFLAAINGSKKQAAQIERITTETQAGLNATGTIATGLDEAIAAEKALQNQSSPNGDMHG